MGTYPIKYFMLNKHELTYEVLIRGDQPAGTVLELRKQMNKLIPLVPAEDIYESGILIEEDLSGAETSQKELISRTKSLEEKYDSNLYERTNALANHLYHRLRRINSSSVSEPSVSEKVKNLVKEFNSTYNSLAKIRKSYISAQTTASKTANCAQSLSLDGASVSVPAASTHCDHSHTHISDLQKIKYDGLTSVHSFVREMNDFSLARNIPTSKLLNYASQIFTGKALIWFRSVRDTVNSWEELIKLLIADFTHYDHDYRLMSEIRKRTQGESENIVIYIATMSELFARLTKPISELEKLDILMHNIRPCYANVLASNSTGIDSIDTLRTLCRNYEKVQCLTSQFREPPKATPNTLAPDLAFVPESVVNYKSNYCNKTYNYGKSNYYSKPNLYSNNKYNNYPNFNLNKSSSMSNKNVDASYRDRNSNAVPPPPARAQVASLTTEPTSTGVSRVSMNAYCPRCRTDDHSLRQCKQERFPICFKCGTKDVTYPRCSKCNPQSKN